MQRACSIFFYDGYVSLAPTIINLSKSLENCEYLVTIFATESSNIPQPKTIGNRVKILYFPNKINELKHLDQLKKLTVLIKIVEIIIYCCQYFTYLIQNNFPAGKLKSNINIAIDLHGLFVALLCFYFFKQKFLFLSLELEEPRKFRYISKLLRKIAELAYKKSECVIVQDEDRFKTLSEYHQYQHTKVFYLPNSSLNDCPATNTGNFFREKFDLSKEEFPYIVLQAGMLNDFVCSKSLAHAFASIDGGFALVFHGVDSRQIKEEDTYIRSLRQLNSNNLFLSLNPLPYDQVDKIYASSTIGLAFYANMGDNLTKIAMASGKLAFYLKHGKPVLVSNLPSLFQLVEKYQFGIIINDASDAQEIKLAIDKIISHYDIYSKNAKCCFAAEFDFQNKMEPIVLFMDDLQAGL